VRVAGIAVDVPSPQRPAARLVVLTDAAGSATVEVTERFTSDLVDLATQLHDMAEAVRSRLTGLNVDRVVVRRADRPPRASNTEGPRLRLLMEGAVTSAARSVVVDTRIGTGRDTGAWFGSNKSGVDTVSAQLLSGSGEDANYLEAVSAALAALRLA
jgi:hypothetical protein